MSNSILRADVEDDHDNNDGNSDQQELELRKEVIKEFVDDIVEGGDKKDEESITTTVTADHADDLEKKQQRLGEGLSSTEDDENDGFKTPTSIEHRILVPTHCPPAPTKSLKRKFEESSITDILRSASKSIHDRIMAFGKDAGSRGR